METQSLFLDRPLQFDGAEKLAGMLTKLSDNTDMWPQEIIQTAHKQLSYLSAFDASVVLDKLDEEKGYAFGSIVVKPRTEMTNGEQQLRNIKTAHIPIIIKEQMLYPFDVFVCGSRYYHMSEQRLREALFNISSFDGPRDRPPDSSLVYDLYPPLRSSEGGFGGAGVKMGSVLLPQLHGTVRSDHKERFFKEASKTDVLAAYANAPEGVRAAYESAIGLLLSDPVKTAETAWERIRPNVVQLRKLANGHYKVKWANTDMFMPQIEEVAPSTVHDLLGDQDLVDRLESDGTVTVSPDAAIKETLDTEEVSSVNQFGLWSVQDTVGNTLTGWAFPQLLTLDLQPMPLCLFSNGSQFGLQDKIAGKLLGKATEIPKGLIRGYGCLYYVDHGNARAFVPMTVTTSYRGPTGEVQYMAHDDFGERVSFTFTEGLKRVVKMGDGEYAIPSCFCWLPLKSKVELVSEPALFSKVAAAKRTGFNSAVEIVGDHDVYSFRGPAIAKLASNQTGFLPHDQAEFLAVSLGMEPAFVKKALARASRGELVTVHGCRPLGNALDKVARARDNIKLAFKRLAHPIRNYLLVKEASLLDDAMTADKILGLGFLNAENIATFVDMLPVLDETSGRLAEMLIAARIGLRDIPEVAIERMLVALDDVIHGLRTLQQKDITFQQ